MQLTSVASLSPLRGNRLLDALRSVDSRRLWSDLEPCDLPRGLVVYDSSLPQTYAYFPVTALISLQHVMGNGSAGEIAVVGSEGLVGVSIFMGGAVTPGRAVVKFAGSGYRVKARSIMSEFTHAASVMQILLRYTEALMTQVSMNVACNRHHSIDQQLCRGLLWRIDQTHSHEIVMTHEHIANVLGIRRESVTASAGRLQEAGYIRYARGRISVTDRSGLESRACECYGVIKKEYDRLLVAKKVESVWYSGPTPADRACKEMR